jgi:hypothetical protein
VKWVGACDTNKEFSERRKIDLKRFKRITAVLMIVLLLSTGFAFAGAAAIVSPASNTIVYSDSLLVSVKVTEPKTIRVTVYEEKETSGENLVSAKISAYTESDLAIIASAKTQTGTLEGAVGIAAAVEPTLSDGTTVKEYTSVAMDDAASYTSDSSLGFYTKQISDVTPGLYRIQVEALNVDGSVGETIHSMVAVKTKPVEEKSDIFQAPQTGALQFLQTLLRNIFR